MNIGKLDRRITLQAPPVVAQNSYGEEAPASFTDAATVPAQLSYPRPGSEVYDNDQLRAEQPTQFTIRYRSDVRPVWRVLYENQTYLITAVTEIGRRVGLTLTCLRRGQESAL